MDYVQYIRLQTLTNFSIKLKSTIRVRVKAVVFLDFSQNLLLIALVLISYDKASTSLFTFIDLVDAI